MHAVSRYDSANRFSHNGKLTTFQTLKNKQSKLDEMTDMMDFVNSIQYVCYLYDDNKSGSRSSRPGVFCKKGFLRNFAKFTGWKTPVQEFLF